MERQSTKRLDTLQQIATSLMAVMVLITFIASNLHAVLWQSSEWLVSTVLPAVVVDLTNDERADNNAAPLQRNSTLDAAATLKAQHMAKNEYFAHYSPEGVSPWHWFDEAGYVYAHAGENLAIHFTDSEEVVEAWMDSPTHRKNIVDAKFTEIGVGTAKGEFEGYDTVYVVQLFGAPGVSREVVAVAPEPIVEPVSESDDTVKIKESAIDSVATESEQVAGAESAPRTELIQSDSVPEVVAVSGQAEPELPAVTTTQPAVERESNKTASTTLEEQQFTAQLNTEVAEIPEQHTSVATPTASTLNDVVVVESPTIATSSGLMVAQIEGNQPHAGYTFASIATQPNKLLEFIYITLGVVALMLISTSIFIEVRRMQYRQVAYGVVMLFVMSGLWLFHAWLTGGAVIV